MLIYQVVNRGNGQAAANADGDISLVSGWQGDVAAGGEQPDDRRAVAKQRDGSAITGSVIARFFDVPDGASTAAIRLALDRRGRSRIPRSISPALGDAHVAHVGELLGPAGCDARRSRAPTGRSPTAGRDAVSGHTRSVAPLPQGRLRPDRLYELVYTARDPLVLGVGLAATRDIVSFFRHAAKDGAGTANPVAGAIDHAVSVGDSQSGNFIRTFIHLGFNRDLQNRIVWDGAFPRIAARQTPMNLRFALPGGAAGAYEPGSDGVVWWSAIRGQDARAQTRRACSIAARRRRTCPKIVEAFGSAEFWGLRMSPDLIGTDARTDLPLPANVRRYYYPGTTHGGGRGGFPSPP